MKPRFFPLLVLSAIAVMSFVPLQRKDNQLTAAEKRQGWVLLFDGKSLDGWKSFRDRASDGWAVSNGELVCKTDGVDKRADLLTREKFENFELSFDWKLAPKMNSGVMYHVTEDNGASYESGPEYSIIDDEGYPDQLNAVQKTGANYDVHAPAVAAARPIGEYNTSKIIVRGSHVEHWLNGKKVVEFEKGSPEWQAAKDKSKWKDVKTYDASSSGHIALQDHGGGVAFKNIKIRKL